MKILHLCLGNFFIDNYSYQENLLPKYHVKQGHDVKVIASLFTFDEQGRGTYLSGPLRYQDKAGFSVVRLEYRKPTRLNRFFRHYKGLLEEIEDFHPDVIFSHNVSYGDTVVVANYIKNHRNVKLFADNHADYVNSARNWLSNHVLHRIIWRYYAHKIEPYLIKCYGVTPMRCRFLREMYHINPKLIEYLPLGVDDDSIPKDRNNVRDLIRKELRCEDADFLIFTGGKIDYLKNTHILLDALNQLNNPRIHLVICGVLTSQMEYLNEIIRNNAHIHYLGWCNAERVIDCMVASDVACFPGTHSTLWEQSIGVGLPLVVKCWPEMEHVNVNGNCIFVRGDDKEELKNVISGLFFSNEFNIIKTMANNASSTFLYSVISKRAIGNE